MLLQALSVISCAFDCFERGQTNEVQNKSPVRKASPYSFECFPIGIVAHAPFVPLQTSDESCPVLPN